MFEKRASTSKTKTKKFGLVIFYRDAERRHYSGLGGRGLLAPLSANHSLLTTEKHWFKHVARKTVRPIKHEHDAEKVRLIRPLTARNIMSSRF